MSQFNKIMVFIDGSNFFIACRRLNLRISYEKFINHLKKDRNVMRMFYYSGVLLPISDKQKRFFKMLKHIGIEPVTTPLKMRKTKCNECGYIKTIKIEKGIDASLSSDLLWFAIQNGYDIAIVITGDADFIPPIEKVRLLGKRVELWAFENSLSSELKEKVDTLKLIDNFLEQIKE